MAKWMMQVVTRRVEKAHRKAKRTISIKARRGNTTRGPQSKKLDPTTKQAENLMCLLLHRL
eukprot:11992015-Prorocentrum_lima.AAC.1